MAVAADRFEQLAGTLTERTSEVLQARVSVIDRRGVVVASTEPERIGCRTPDGPDDTPGKLRVPFELDDAAGAVIVEGEGSGDAVPPRVARVLIDLVLDQTAMRTWLPSRHELKNQFILSLLLGTGDDQTDAHRKGEILGMDLTLPRAVILIDASDYVLRADRTCSPEAGESMVRRRAQVVIDCVVTFFGLPSDNICAYIGNGEIAVLKASTSQDLQEWSEGDDHGASPSWANLSALKRASAALLSRIRATTHAPISMGIGRYHPGIRGMAASYKDALAALSLGRRLHGPNRVHCLDQLGIAAFVGVPDQQTKIDLAVHLLSPLDHEAELIETLNAYFVENCSPSAAAERLCIHRNTLGYRLDKITALTGLDPRRFGDAVQMLLALLLRSFQESPARCATA